MMNVLESLTWSHKILNDLNVPHALIGGMALSEYGYGRATQDVDWLIPEEFVNDVIKAFTAEKFTIFHRSEDVIQFSGEAQIDFLIARRPISRGMIDDASYSQSLEMPVVKAEDLIGLKIQAYKNDKKRKFKDLSDIQELIEQNNELDWVKIKFYADQFDEWETLKELKE
jgi:hypothetical protein